MPYKITAVFWVNDAEDADAAERGAQYALQNVSSKELEFDSIISVESDDEPEACDKCASRNIAVLDSNQWECHDCGQILGER